MFQKNSLSNYKQLKQSEIMGLPKEMCTLPRSQDQISEAHGPLFQTSGGS